MIRNGWSISRRFTLVISLLLLMTGLLSVFVQVQNSERHANEVLQRISLNLASHIADSNKAMLTPDGLNIDATHGLFDRLMEVNPSVEVYLLDQSGQIIADAAPPGALKLTSVNLAPVQALLSGRALPVLGDDPRNPSRKKVFSASRLQHNGRDWGYLYIILAGQEYDQVSRSLVNQDLWKLSWMGMLILLAMGMIAAFLALRWITRPLHRLSLEVASFRTEAGAQASTGIRDSTPGEITDKNDEIAQLRGVFLQMTERINHQWQQLNEFDHQRRELVANISHDLRTPLTSLHGYLETLKLKAGHLSDTDRDRYLDIALSQSRKVGNLAQALFELARLEYGGVKLQKESFSLVDLIQDVAQKFELATEARKQILRITPVQELPMVHADLGLLERVLTNLIDNAIRHSHEGSTILISVCLRPGAVQVCVEDNGPGLPQRVRNAVFHQTPAASAGWGLAGDSPVGLGLMIVRRILQLHESDLELGPDSEQIGGTRLFFSLGCARD